MLLELANRPEKSENTENTANLELLKERIHFYGDMLERLLGAPKGCIEPVSADFVEKILK